MFRTTAAVFSLLVASPVLANYGDIDVQLTEIKGDTVVIAQPFDNAEATLATHEICPLPLDHLVTVPVEFMVDDALTVACLNN